MPKSATFGGELPAFGILSPSSLSITLSHDVPVTSSGLYPFRRHRASGGSVIDGSEKPQQCLQF